MTPAEARRIDREEFEAECAAVRHRAYHFVEQRRHEARAEIAHWLGRQAPAFRFVAPYTPKAKLQPKHEPKRRVGQKRTINGLSLTAREWADHLGVSYGALCVRIHRLGSLEAAINFQPDERRRPVTVAGKSMSLNAWASYLGIASSTLHHRIKRQGSAETVITDLLANPPGVVSNFWNSKETGA